MFLRSYPQNCENDFDAVFTFFILFICNYVKLKLFIHPSHCRIPIAFLPHVISIIIKYFMTEMITIYLLFQTRSAVWTYHTLPEQGKLNIIFTYLLEISNCFNWLWILYLYYIVGIGRPLGDINIHVRL